MIKNQMPVLQRMLADLRAIVDGHHDALTTGTDTLMNRFIELGEAILQPYLDLVAGRLTSLMEMEREVAEGVEARVELEVVRQELGVECFVPGQ